MTGKMSRLTRRRFDELIATQARIKRQWWNERMSNSNVGRPNHLQRKRERVLNLIESTLNDMCFFGLIDAVPDYYEMWGDARP